MRRYLITALLVLMAVIAQAAPPYSTIQVRRDTPVNWTSFNPVLASGELGCEMTGSPARCTAQKVGDGVTPWTGLPYTSIAARAVQGNYSGVTVHADDVIARGPSIDARAYATLAAADAAAVVAGKLLVISTQWNTVPSALNAAIKILPGGKLNNAGSLTINGTFDGADGCFIGAGAVTGLKEARPEWWTVNAVPGTTDMAAAINKAFAASTGKVVLSDQYGVSGNVIAISHNVNAEFVGNATLKVLSTTVSHVVIKINSTVTKCRISGLNIDLNYPSTTWQPQAIYLDGAADVTFDDPHIFNSAVTRAWPGSGWGYGIYLNGAWSNVTVNNLHVEDLIYGIATNRNTSTGGGLHVNGGLFEYLSGDGVEIDVPLTSAYDIFVAGARFFRVGSNNTVRGMGVGASGAPGTTIHNVKVTGCTFTECDLQGVHIEDGTRDVVIADNTFIDCGQGAVQTDGAAISVFSTDPDQDRKIGNVTIRGNHVYGGALSDYGIAVGGSYSDGVITVSGNHVRGAGNGVGILAGSAHGNMHVTDNIVSNWGGVGINYYAHFGSLKGNICFDDQTIKTQTYGIGLGTSGYSQTIRDNMLYGNINQGFYVATMTFPKRIGSDSTYLADLAVGSGSTWSDWNSVINLGAGGSGTICVTARYDTSWTTGLFSYTWNGTTLTVTKVSLLSSGSITQSGTVMTDNFRMSGNWLQTRAFNGFGTAISGLTIEVVVDGSILLK